MLVVTCAVKWQLGLARAGCSVGILDLRIEKAKVVEKTLRTEGLKSVMSLAIDVTKKEEFHDALKHILNKFNHVDILVNGAGINSPSPFLEISIEEWHSSSRFPAYRYVFRMSGFWIPYA